MNGEEFNALVKMEGYVGIPYTDIADACDPCETREDKEVALAGLFVEYGLDITKPMKVGWYHAGRIFVFQENPEGKLVTPEDLLVGSEARD